MILRILAILLLMTGVASADSIVSSVAVKRSLTDQTINSGLFKTTVIWDTEVPEFGDPDGWSDISEAGPNPERLTVPFGLDIEYVSISTNISWDTNSAGRRSIYLVKNGSQLINGLRYFESIGAAANAQTTQNVRWPQIEAQGGDYFEVMVDQNSNADLDIENGDWTWCRIDGIRAVPEPSASVLVAAGVSCLALLDRKGSKNECI
jgi:hypothetical protein